MVFARETELGVVLVAGDAWWRVVRCSLFQDRKDLERGCEEAVPRSEA